jgi:hypothetical protein
MEDFDLTFKPATKGGGQFRDFWCINLENLKQRNLEVLATKVQHAVADSIKRNL